MEWSVMSTRVSNGPQNRAVLNMEEPSQVDREVRAIVSAMFGDEEPALYGETFHDVLRLFAGEYPVYQACNTPYHDQAHTMHVLLASARLAHGLRLGGEPLGLREFELLLVSALMHDIGYLQEEGDTEGTGAKYTPIHVTRGIDFMKEYFRDRLSEDELRLCACMLQCTDIDVEVGDIPFRDAHEKLLGCVLGTADLIGQMADDIYVEKLVHLYTEFKEGGVEGFASEYDLLKKTAGFYKFMKFRLEHHLAGVFRLVRAHFKDRWGLDRDLYEESIQNNIRKLTEILERHGWNYRN